MDKDTLEYNELISLLSVYLEEWNLRDQVYWNHIFKVFYANIVVILLPNIASMLNITLPNLPVFLYRMVGVAMSVVFLYVAYSYNKRSIASIRTYSMLLRHLPEEYQRISILKPLSSHPSDLQVKSLRIVKHNTGAVLYSTMFIALLAISTLLLITDFIM